MTNKTKDISEQCVRAILDGLLTMQQEGNASGINEILHQVNASDHMPKDVRETMLMQMSMVATS